MTHLVLPLGEGDLSGARALWFSLLYHMGRFERAPASVSDTRNYSVCCDRCSGSPGQRDALSATGHSDPSLFFALRVRQ